MLLLRVAGPISVTRWNSRRWFHHYFELVDRGLDDPVTLTLCGVLFARPRQPPSGGPVQGADRLWSEPTYSTIAHQSSICTCRPGTSSAHSCSVTCSPVTPAQTTTISSSESRSTASRAMIPHNRARSPP
jgi:hypothetical protein